MTPADYGMWSQEIHKGTDPHTIKDADGGAPWGVLTVRDVERRPNLNPPASRAEMMRKAQEDARRHGSHPVMIEFTTGDKQSLHTLMAIPPIVVDEARAAEPFQAKSRLRGDFEVPFSRDSVLQYVLHSPGQHSLTSLSL